MIDKLVCMFDGTNELAKDFRMERDQFKTTALHDVSIRILFGRNND